MIISRTPFRISFMGGGTDLPSFYEQEEGFVVSTTINKYMHLTINRRFDTSFRISYSQTEIADIASEIKHPIVRTVLQKHFYQKHGLEIISMADIPSGTGLGSSSSFTVGLLNALKAHQGIFQSAEDLAAEASRIEIMDLKEPIGKQDQYAAAYGGFQTIRFLPNGQTIAAPLICPVKNLQSLEASLLLFYTGASRSASTILQDQKNNTLSKLDVLREMKKGAFEFQKQIQEEGNLQKLGGILHRGWELKRGLATQISSSQIDQWYERGLRAGAYGGKILGAGGGGFLMFICEPSKQDQVMAELKELRPIPIRFEPLGSRILFVG